MFCMQSMNALVRLCACADSSEQSLGCVYNKYQNLELAQQFPFGYIFNFYINLFRTLCKRTVETLIRRCNLQSVASDLCLHCLPMSHKKDAVLIWGKKVFYLENHHPTILKQYVAFTNILYNSYDSDNSCDKSYFVVFFYIFLIPFYIHFMN